MHAAADSVKQEADLILMKKDLAVILEGILEGRRTFANSLKYIFMATSANFGNMFSMAGASLLLPFLPVLPKQILLINFLTDIPEMTISTDRVDEELTAKPHRIDIGFIGKFMMVFGLISSFFDFLTFGLLLLMGATPEQFRTGWVIESVISAALTVLVIRTRRPIFQSPPSKPLFYSTLLIVVITLFMPYFPFAKALGFTPLTSSIYWMIGIVVCLYVITAETAKRFFYRKFSY